MNFSIGTYNKKREKTYLEKFSARRYNLFQSFENLYKRIFNNKDGRMNLIIKIIDKKRPIKILEIGSGTFPVYQFLSEDIKKKSDYNVCEINEEKVEYLRKKYPQIKIKNAEALSLPYPNNYFDLVLSKGVLHHIDDSNPLERKKKKIIFLKESKRVLKKGGINLLMDFCYNPKRFRDFFWHGLYKIILKEGDYYYLKENAIKELFKLTNYKKIKSYPIDTFKGLYYCVLGEK